MSVEDILLCLAADAGEGEQGAEECEEGDGEEGGNPPPPSFLPPVGLVEEGEGDMAILVGIGENMVGERMFTGDGGQGLGT